MTSDSARLERGPFRASFERALGWLRWHPYTAIAVVLLLVLGFPFLLRREGEGDMFFVRAKKNLRAGGDVYVQKDGFLSPPFMAFLAIPFTFVPPLVSRAA